MAEPPPEQFQEDFDSFKKSYGKEKSWDMEKVDVAKERRIGVPKGTKTS